LLHNLIKEMRGIVDFNWCGELFYPYYDYFNDGNLRYRSGSLIAFWGLLTEWEDGSGFPFYTGVEEYDAHHIDKYLKEFLKYSSDIKKEYPNIYYIIVESLIHLNNREDMESKFPNIPSEVFISVRKKLLQNDIQKPDTNVYEYAFKEAGMSY